MATHFRSRLALLTLISVILLLLGGLGIETEQFPNATRREVILQVRRYPENRRPWDRVEAIRVRLDTDRLRAYDLSVADVTKAFVPSSILSSPTRADPPPGVVFVPRLYRPELFKNLIVKATPEGDIVWLKDIATVESVPAGPGVAADRDR